MQFRATSSGQFFAADRVFRCALGKGGLKPADQKCEGDGASPIGIWPLRRVLYRADRVGAPQTALPVQALGPDDGWCDAVGDRLYNQPVQHPYHASAEHLWRDDHVYDLIVVLGHNDGPVVDGAGSAIFMHVAKPDYTPTEGCVALAYDDLVQVLALASPGSTVKISA
jgi:L,D-peptidoglycan transpeptidase YkuD (ErfK/YbiS/YcfS/YnhG family)